MSSSFSMTFFSNIGHLLTDHTLDISLFTQFLHLRSFLHHGFWYLGLIITLCFQVQNYVKKLIKTSDRQRFIVVGAEGECSMGLKLMGFLLLFLIRIKLSLTEMKSIQIGKEFLLFGSLMEGAVPNRLFPDITLEISYCFLL